MTQTLIMHPDADVEAVVELNADDYGEDGYQILRQTEENGRLYVTVMWESEAEKVAYVRLYDSLDEDELSDLRDHIENGPYQIDQNPSGNWSIRRDKSFREAQ